MPVKTSIEGCAVSLCFYCTTGRVYSDALDHYLTWVQILDPSTVFQMGSSDAAEYCDGRSDSICPSPGANPRICYWQKASHHKRASSMLYCWCNRGFLQLFHQLFAAHRHSNLTQRFRTLIRQSKGLYSSALLSNLCAPWLTRSFWHCFASSTVVSWKQFCHIDQFHKVFSSHCFTVNFNF